MATLRPNTECRECGYHSESMEHIVCVCPTLLHDRRTHLRVEWNKLGLRTCRQAIIAALKQENTKLNIQFTKFVVRTATLLGKGKERAVNPLPALLFVCNQNSSCRRLPLSKVHLFTVPRIYKPSSTIYLFLFLAFLNLLGAYCITNELF